MSDLIPTPPRTQSPVSNDTFEALIDLLTFDGIDENSTENEPRSQAKVSLRDPSGKLDFDKIRLMFASQHGQKPFTREKKRPQSIQTLPSDEGGSDDECHSRCSTHSTAPSRSISMSPKPVEYTTTGHRRSSTFGNQPWTPIHENVTGAKVEDVRTTLLPPPLSLDELNTALAGAQEEVKSLRQQYEDLQALVSKRFGAEMRDLDKSPSIVANTDEVTPAHSNGRIETRDTGSEAQPSIEPPASLPPSPASDAPTAIANLSESEAKRALGTLVRSLNLSPGAITAMASASMPVESTSPRQRLSPLNLARQHDVASIARALKFLGTVDELVWRRSSASSGPRTLLPVFSEENVVSLVARLELWERAVRRSARH